MRFHSFGEGCRIGLLGIATLLTGACDGQIGDELGTVPDQSDTPSSSSSSGATGGGSPENCTSHQPGPLLIRRLTRFEYNNTVRDLLGDDTSPGDALPPDPDAGGFDNNASSAIPTQFLAEKLFAVAETVSTRASSNLPALMGCDPVTDEEACVKAFIDRFGARAYRRPLEAAEAARLWSVFVKGKTDEGLAGGVQRIVSVMLQTPQFFYRPELPEGVPDAVVDVGPWPMASRLSYLIWGSMPDDALFTAARAGALSTPAQILAQARRMLSDRRARDVVNHFHRSWLKLEDVERIEKDVSTFPKFSSTLPALFSSETQAFVSYAIFDGAGDLGALLTAPYTLVNGPLAQFYGLSGVTGNAFQRVDLNPEQRSGLLTHGGLMALLARTHATHPIKRGLFVRASLLCTPPPDPPPGVLANSKMPPPGLTAREELAFHRTSAACNGCHKLMDPIGFGFENLDGVGLWRTTDEGQAIDASGEIVESDVAGTFVGPVELGRKLAESEQVGACVMGKWFQFAYGRGATEADRCNFAQIETPWKASHQNIKELLAALTQTDAFLYRRNSP